MGATSALILHPRDLSHSLHGASKHSQHPIVLSRHPELRPNRCKHPGPGPLRRHLMAPSNLPAKDRGAAQPLAERSIQDALLASPPQDLSLPISSTVVRLPTGTLTARTPSRTLSTTSKSLLPPTERRSYQGRTWPRSRRKEDSKEDAWNLVSDGASAGRQGRQFTVANVGHNGRIYLRPTIRPVHSRYPQANLVFPITPPTTGARHVSNPGESVVANTTSRDFNNIQPMPPSQWTPTPSATPLAANQQYFPDMSGADWPTTRRRAMSDSTVHDLTAAHEHESDIFKVVISKASEEHRPRTMEDFTTAPLLNISIPSWRIGTLRFTLRGTPVFRGSSYAPTEDARSSVMPDPPQRPHCSRTSLLRPNIDSGEPVGRKPLKLGSLATVPSAQPEGPDFVSHDSSCPNLPVTAAAKSIEPEIFTDLTFKPACDNTCIVRYSASGVVIAATPPRLVAEITSPKFLDYELVSHFFLTFRAFLSPGELLRMLIARLRWALSRTDEVGMIVRVRTFVAIRHWILNYFVDDFVLEYDLRVTFCTLLNEFVDELSQNASFRKVQLKILAELKKCWRRMCAQHWDGSEFNDLLGPEAPIAPGGIAGNRNPQLDPTYWQLQGLEPPSVDALVPPPKASTESTSVYADASRAAPIGDFIILGNRPGTPDKEHVHHDIRGAANSPSSPASLDAYSCSFPGKSSKKPKPSTVRAMTAHPVLSQSTSHQANMAITIPKTRTDKSSRNTASAHKRNNSISDSMREYGSDKGSWPERNWSTPLPYAGSLVRGNLLPPGRAYVDYEPYGLDGAGNRLTSVFNSDGPSLSKETPDRGALPGHGVRKLLGSVRRVLRSRGHGPSAAHSNLIALSSTGPSAPVANGVGESSVLAQDGQVQHSARPPVRIDVLGAEVAEDFKKAMREEQETMESDWLGHGAVPRSAPAFAEHANYSAAHMDSSTFDSLPQNSKPRPASDMGITIGSKSIVIVDDTLAAGASFARQREAAASNALTEALSGVHARNRAHPTPPNTPPATIVGDGTSRRCSHQIAHGSSEIVVADDGLPPFVPDLATLQGPAHTDAVDDVTRCSFRGRTRKGRLVSRGAFEDSRGRGREKHMSLNSVVQGQFCSLSPSVVRPPTMESFDATTDSTCSVGNDDSIGVPVPAPLRVLRRRRGGDLRAAANVGDSERLSLARSHSLGSLATYTESIRSSYLLNTRPNSAGYSSPAGRGEVFSLGNLTKRAVNSRLSLVDAPCDKVIMRPSFEKEAQKLAQIPDDEDDDGGIESALLKLEGKYNKKKASKLHRKRLEKSARRVTKSSHGKDDEANNGASALEPGHGETNDCMANGGQAYAEKMKSFLSMNSDESYCSIPLLERGLSRHGSSKDVVSWEWKDQSVLQDSDHRHVASVSKRSSHSVGQVQCLSFDMVQKTDSIERIVPGATIPSAQARDHSFLDDQSAQGTDVSSGASQRSAESADVDDGDAFFSKYRSPAYPPQTRPSSSPAARNPMPTTRLSSDAGTAAREHKPLPPTPVLTPVTLHNTAPTSPRRLAQQPAEAGPARKFSVHLPFILAFDSDILAQQFTLIEKDALNEIDWKELIDMKWKNAARSDCRSWVHFLRNNDAQGVEVVIARFNLMVKWAISEIALTQNTQERARCIIKLIHIASHCRRYRNFATLAQLTLALCSSEVSRLKATWQLVPAHDVETLKGLENLMTPTRNFHALRQEMETGSDSGCIPFAGVYTQDLLFNAQRPSVLPDASSLVNFERCRVTAMVVKTLLRLLEASTRYAFMPVDGITERCLWIGALSDVEIRRYCDGLE
ncbi:hypothetical protein CDD82_2 [Ophiocordyceps australis]|uniref:Ras-GEF domain-containing protein n=1 Tax=Ophiocordyceps australis TaxID=1399860 RepID=A0A2C5ZVF4_9HYPO|nr:hypothetical protein CDD82_2 [Ophiocordyceps australis]